MSERFYAAASMLPAFENTLRTVPTGIAENAAEIRVRAGRPLIVETPSERYVCGGRRAALSEIFGCIKYFCDYSVYSCERELSEGWMTLKGGHRAGFTGTAVIKDGRVSTIRDISSLNIRIAREHKGIAEKLFSLTAAEDGMKGLLILGPPLSAKTTMLRDYARLAAGLAKVAVIDERSEIAAVYAGEAQNDMGLSCDILNCFPKVQGIIQAVRSLSPEYLICDETAEEYPYLAQCAGKGVKLILSAHCGSIAEAKSNAAVKALVEAHAVNFIALLDRGANIGRVKGLWRIEEYGDIDGCCGGNDLYGNRSRVLGQVKVKI